MDALTSHNSFSISKALFMAKNAFFKHFWLLFLAQAFMTLGLRQLAEFIPAVPINAAIRAINEWFPLAILTQFFPKVLIPEISQPVSEWLSYFSVSVMEPLCVGGSFVINLAVIDGKSASFGDIFSKKHLFWRYLFSNLLLALGFVLNAAILFTPFLFSANGKISFLPMGLGILAAVCVGVFFIANFGCHQLLVVDEDLGVIEAIKRSWEITRGSRTKLFVFVAVLWLICIGFAVPAFIFIGLLAPVFEQIPYLVKLLLSCVFCAALIPAQMYWELAWVACYRQLAKVPVETGLSSEVIENTTFLSSDSHAPYSSTEEREIL